jgi:hypothetical protein
VTVTHPFGRAEADGTTFVKTAQGDVAVGQYTIGTAEEALAYFVGKFDQLVAEADLTLSRLNAGKGQAEAAMELVKRLRAQSETPACVGDLNILARKADEIAGLAEAKSAERAAAKAAARAAAIARRTEIVVEAEKLAISTQWKSAQERFTALLEEWKTLARGDRDAEQELWKRFSHARQTFDRARRHHFTELSKTAAAAKSVKAELVRQATELSTSTDWGNATTKFKQLMDQWKAAPRGSKKDDDALWEKFRAAQQVFFEAKNAANAVRDEELKGNLDAKLELLKEAEAILPVKDIPAAKAALRAISERWHKAGHVPRADISRVEGRLRKVEEAIAEAEREEWRKNDPSRKAFAASTASKFAEAVDKLAAEVAAAKSSGSKDLAKLEAQLANAQALLEAANKHA